MAQRRNFMWEAAPCTPVTPCGRTSALRDCLKVSTLIPSWMKWEIYVGEGNKCVFEGAYVYKAATALTTVQEMYNISWSQYPKTTIAI